MTLEIVHAWSKEQKADYNKEYYAKNKWRWTKNGGWRYQGENNPDSVRFEERYKLNEGIMNDYNRFANKLRDRAEYYEVGSDAYNNLLKEADRYSKWALQRQRATDASRGDVIRSRAIAEMHDNGFMNKKNTAQIKTPSKLDRVKSKTDKITKSAKSAASTVGHKITNAGKSFVSNWKLGMGIK